MADFLGVVMMCTVESVFAQVERLAEMKSK